MLPERLAQCLPSTGNRADKSLPVSDTFECNNEVLACVSTANALGFGGE